MTALLPRVRAVAFGAQEPEAVVTKSAFDELSGMYTTLATLLKQTREEMIALEGVARLNGCRAPARERARAPANTRHRPPAIPAPRKPRAGTLLGCLGGLL